MPLPADQGRQSLQRAHEGEDLPRLERPVDELGDLRAAQDGGCVAEARDPRPHVHAPLGGGQGDDDLKDGTKDSVHI